MTREEFIEAYAQELERRMATQKEYGMLRLKYENDPVTLRQFCARFFDQATGDALHSHGALNQLMRSNPAFWHVAKQNRISSMNHLRKFLFDCCHIGAKPSPSPEALVKQPLSIVA